MKIKNINLDTLIEYVDRQLSVFCPDGRPCRTVVAQHIDEALERLCICINSVRAWPLDEFDYLHSSQYATFLYYLSNTIWTNTGGTEVPTKLFLLNKALNGIDCFYQIRMPQRFFIGHSVGIVLVNTQYSDYLVLYQGCTVGKSRGVAPVIEERTLLYPGTAIIGRSLVRAGSVISVGARVVNQDTAGESLVFEGADGKLSFKAGGNELFSEIFRI